MTEKERNWSKITAKQDTWRGASGLLCTEQETRLCCRLAKDCCWGAAWSVSKCQGFKPIYNHSDDIQCEHSHKMNHWLKSSLRKNLLSLHIKSLAQNLPEFDDEILTFWYENVLLSTSLAYYSLFLSFPHCTVVACFSLSFFHQMKSVTTFLLKVHACKDAWKLNKLVLLHM